jgi:hypothetical protein
MNDFIRGKFVADPGQNPFSSFPPSADGEIKKLNLISFMR